MDYEPREGEDYLVDLYALAEVERTSSDEDIKQALNERTKEYHPDRLDGLAPEFITKGERVSKLLNRARVILLDPEKRTEYDEILTSWEGPLSTDGTPIILYSRMKEAELVGKTPDEVDATFAAKVEKIEQSIGYKVSRIGFLERLMDEATGEDIPEDLRQEYEDALLQRDAILAVEEGIRSEVIGLPDPAGKRYEASLDYGSEVTQQIAEAREIILQSKRAIAIGNVSTRLALLTGEGMEPVDSTDLQSPLSPGLPDYYDQQAARVVEIAEEREEITDKRLGNMQPIYPEAELQSDFNQYLIIGIEAGGEYGWFAVKIDPDTFNAVGLELSEEISDKLSQAQYADVIKDNYGIIIVKKLEQIRNLDLFGVAVAKYISKYKEESEVSS